MMTLKFNLNDHSSSIYHDCDILILLFIYDKKKKKKH